MKAKLLIIPKPGDMFAIAVKYIYEVEPYELIEEEADV
jgi:hypothetical protein